MMRQLLFDGPRSVVWADVPTPELRSDDAALVAPLAVSTCDMDAVALSGAIRFRTGVPLGHEGVAVVEAVGDSVSSVVPGDRVIVPWQISCGRCEPCRRGRDTFCESVPAGSCYGWGPHVERWGGFLCDRFEVPFADHMLVPLPDSLSPVTAAGLSDNLVDAWRAVGPPLAETGGGRVLVVGGASDDGGSIGVYAAAFAVAMAADDIWFASESAVLRASAARYGASTIDPTRDDLGDLGGFDVCVDSSGDAGRLVETVLAAAPHGVVTCTAGAVHRGAPVPMPVYEMYMRATTFRTGWVPTRSLIDTPRELIAAGVFDPTDIATVATFDDAVDALAEPFTKLILTTQPSRS